MSYTAPPLGPNTHPQWNYPPGTVRWRRMKVNDSEFPEATPGWRRSVHSCDSHPVNGLPFLGGYFQIWIKEIKL